MNTRIKHIFASLLISGSIIGGVAFFATPAAALTVDELQAQIRDLVAKVTALQEQLRIALANQGTSGGTGTSSDISITAVPRICQTIPARGLAIGVRGDDVTGLQEFLRAEGVLSAEATGYFGSQTRAALAAWQANQGVQAVGSFGPLTRERVRIWCENRQTLQARPTSGSAPLTVTFVADVTLTNNAMVADAGNYKITFGDGTEHVFSCSDTTSGVCRGPHSVTHTYTNNGAYTADLVHYGFFGPPGTNPNGTVRGSVYIHVGDGGVACTKEYRPVCASKPVVCVTAPCNPVQQTYGNACTARADGATVLYEGACRDESANPANDPRCKSWYDGCNSCSRSDPNGPAMCTLRACTPESMTKPYCTAYFDGNAGNRPPSISAFSGPTTLSLNQSGTWTVRASDPENQSLSYSITWGDEYLSNVQSGSGSAPARDSFIQTTTFTHAYAQAGTYTVTVVVRDASGQEARTSTTVRVGTTIDCSVIPATMGPESLEWQRQCGGVACTMEYNPVCGRPVGCANTCPPGMYCAAICRLHEPQTYGNRCMLNASGAQFLYQGQCDGRNTF